MKIIISETAWQNGTGTYPHKRVAGLTSEEKQATRSGATVIFASGYPAGGNHGTVWRRVLPGRCSREYYPRVFRCPLQEAYGYTV